MSNIRIDYPPGATPLSPDDLKGLIPTYITTQGQLNVLEQDNIKDAVLWVQSKSAPNVLSVGFVHDLHRKMFEKVWRWAGRARNTDTIPGIDWQQISTQLGELIKTTEYWIQHKTFPFDEIAVLFHHRLVQIHVFPNGNGRHARLMTDILLTSNGHTEFSWGAASSTDALDVQGPRRKSYIEALRAADNNKFDLLLNFVRT